MFKNQKFRLTSEIFNIITKPWLDEISKKIIHCINIYNRIICIYPIFKVYFFYNVESGGEESIMECHLHFLKCLYWFFNKNSQNHDEVHSAVIYNELSLRKKNSAKVQVLPVAMKYFIPKQQLIIILYMCIF